MAKPRAVKEKEPKAAPSLVYKPRNDSQRLVREIWGKESLILLTLGGPAGTGKAQPIDAVIMTPSGPKRMGDMMVGESVCTTAGTVANVTGVFPQGVKQVCRITFSDGTSTECCEDHLWQVGDIGRRWGYERVVTTKYIKENFHRNGRNYIYIPSSEPAYFEEREYMIQPYMMGILLADGGLTCSVSVTVPDAEILDRLKGMISQDYKFHHSSSHDYRVTRCDYSKPAPNIYIRELTRLNLYGSGSHDKHIPSEYLHGSVQQRTELLQGIMDGDGTVDKKTGMPSFCTTSADLCRDFCYLVNSLGGTCSVNKKQPFYKSEKTGERVQCRECFILSIRLPNSVFPFSLRRKAELVRPRTKYFPRRYVTDVAVIGEKAMQCISVSDPSQLYLTDHFIVTHNTTCALAEAFLDVFNGRKKKVYLARPTVSVEEDLGFFPGTLEEKLGPWMPAFRDVFGELSLMRLDQLEKYWEAVPVGMLRGRTITDATLIVDEAQNCLYSHLECIATRPGRNSRIVLCGDAEQSDLHTRKDNVPLTVFCEHIKETPGYQHIQFSDKDQVRHPFVTAIIKELRKHKDF